MEEPDKGKALRNLLWTEFKYSQEDLLSFVKGRLIDFQKLIKGISDFAQIEERIDASLQRIEYVKKILSRMMSANTISESLDPDLHLNFNEVKNAISIGYTDIVIMLSQRTTALRSSKVLPQNIGKKLNALEKTLKMPKSAEIASEKCLNECLEIAYGCGTTWNLSTLKPIVVWLRPDYRYLHPTKAVCVPPNDRANLCRWSTIAHETMHSRLDDIKMSFLDLREAYSEGDTRLEEERLKVVNELMQNPSEVYHERFEKQDSFVKGIKLAAGEVYREVYSVLLGDDYYIPEYFLIHQFEEILCDIGCAKIAGPADAILLAHSAADSCRNPELDIQSHLYELAHPPCSVRVMYEWKLLKDTASAHGMNLSGKRIDAIGEQLYGLVGIDISGRKKTKREDLCRYLIKVYIDVVEELLPELSGLVDLILAEKPRFNQNRWKKIVRCYNNMDLEKGLQNEDLLPYDLTNLAWLKVMDIFRDTIEKGKSYRDFINKREQEAQFFKSLWDYLATQ